MTGDTDLCYFLDATPRPASIDDTAESRRNESWAHWRDQGPVRPAHVLTLDIGVGALPALLSTGVKVYLGHISHSLYMLYEIVHTAWTWATMQFEITLTPSWSAKFVVVGLIMLTGVAARAG